MTLSSYKAFAALHFVVNEGIVQVQFHHRDALVILLVQVKWFRCQQLEADVVWEKLLSLE